MSIDAGGLRHRVTIQERLNTQDPQTGENTYSWEDVATVWAKVEPLSAREFIQSQTTQSQVVARITVRYIQGLSADMRILHNGTVYNIGGVLPDNESGLEYITIPVSQGVNDGE